ncbi:hydrolase [Microlunatus endophyticus]|uniref:Hydrolase n=1 Tax=Microlunatus endophyticus TaxID=1716077 RepID=A0A917W4Y6_9ACTN|nr:serine hydrolase domain-containing protein [Microlunatus endophyticus]GGL69141.1 hydrolase [Microlunatus endophyticus]
MTTTTLESPALAAALDALHHSGVPGAIAEIRTPEGIWSGAAGVRDLETGTPATPDLQHRVGSVTKSFTAVAVLRQVEQGELELDAPVGRYLPDLVPGERGDRITVRMLINHTSGLPEYLPYAYPSLRAFPRLAQTTPDSLVETRFRRWDPLELIKLGVEAPPTGRPGDTPGVYSNTNYLLLGQLLQRITGLPAETVITRDVIEPAGLQHTFFPTRPELITRHTGLYESWFGMFDPPEDFSVFDMSWVGVAASLVSTVSDLNEFFAQLITGQVISPAPLAQMQRTNAVVSFEQTLIDYGLGLLRKEIPGVGTLWGHDGTVWGGGTIALSSADGTRQLALAINRQRWNSLDADGRPAPHPIDRALNGFLQVGLNALRS